MSFAASIPADILVAEEQRCNPAADTSGGYVLLGFVHMPVMQPCLQPAKPWCRQAGFCDFEPSKQMSECTGQHADEAYKGMAKAK